MKNIGELLETLQDVNHVPAELSADFIRCKNNVLQQEARNKEEVACSYVRIQNKKVFYNQSLHFIRGKQAESSIVGSNPSEVKKALASSLIGVT